MADILDFVAYKKKKDLTPPDFNSLEWAKEYLEEYYEMAFEWSLDELKKTIKQSSSYPTMACEAYTLIYEFRLTNEEKIHLK